jgi:hypothetical protein
MLIEYAQQLSPQQISRPCTPEARNWPRVIVSGRVIIESLYSTLLSFTLIYQLRPRPYFDPAQIQRNPIEQTASNDILYCQA